MCLNFPWRRCNAQERYRLQRINRHNPTIDRRVFQAHSRLDTNSHVLQGVFFLSYLGVIYLFIRQTDVLNDFFIGLIFFFGAIFVYVGIIIQRKTFNMLTQTNQNLKLYAEKLERNQAKLIRLNKNLENEIQEKEKAKKSDQLKSDFLSQVSHELRTPLTSIFGFAKLIKRDFETICGAGAIPASLVNKQKRIEKNTSIISIECGRLTRMINNVLDLAKIESGQATWNDQPISLDDILTSSLASVKGLVHEKKALSLKIETPGEAPTILIDPDLITQVIVNLLSNSIKFSESGTITVKAQRDEKGVQISIHDEGIGIDEDNLPKIFDKYHIARTGNTLGASKLGTGLGLPICKQIVEHYGGTIRAESEFGKGSHFFVTLPPGIIVEQD